MRMRRNRRGANAVEFALIFPVLIGFLFGVMEYSWYFNRHLAVSASTRDAVREAAMVPSDAEVPASTVAYNIVAERLAGFADEGSLEVTVEETGTSPNRVLVVSVRHPYDTLSGLLPTPSHVESTLSLRMEDQLQ